MIDTIIAQIQLRRPTVNLSTTRQHALTIHRVYKKLWPDDREFLSDRIVSCPTEILLGCIPEGRKVDTAKSYGAALGIFTKRPELSSLVTNANREYSSRVKAHIPTQSEMDHKLSREDIDRIDKEIYNAYTNNRSPYTIRSYILWSLVSGKFIPPRRNLDWVAFKLRNVNPDEDNYLDHTSRTFVFNRYKTVGIYGQDCIRVPDTLYDLFTEYCDCHDGEWLFTTQAGKQISSSAFNTMVNRLSNSASGRGVNQYRKAYLQHEFGNILGLQDTMRAMGSSAGVINSYIKNLV
jgi:hypothetical protein